MYVKTILKSAYLQIMDVCLKMKYEAYRTSL